MLGISAQLCTGKAGNHQNINAVVSRLKDGGVFFENLGATKKQFSECDAVEMRKDTSALEKEKDLHLVLSSRELEMIAIRTPFTMFCINRKLYIVKNHELQQGHAQRYKIRGT